MNSRLRLAVFALVLLMVAAGVGICSGSRRASSSAAAPLTPMLDVAGFRTVALLPPEERKPWLGGTQFARPLGPDPRRGGEVPTAGRAGGTTEPAAPAAAGTREYRVRENDTMSKIARREYGDANLAAWLLQVNRISDPTKLGIGDLIQLPPRPDTAGPAASGAAPPTAPPVSPTTPAKPAETRSYVVGKGETLGEISQKVYGTARHADALMKANGIKRAQDLRAGQKLTIPPL